MSPVPRGCWPWALGHKAVPGEMSQREQRPSFLSSVPTVLQQPWPHSLPRAGRGVRADATICELSGGVLSWLQSTACAPLGPRRGLPSSRQHPARWVGLGRRCPSAQGWGTPATPLPTTGPGWLQSGSLLASAVSLKSCSCLFPRSDTETRPTAVPHPTRGKEERSLGGWVRHPPAASARPAVPRRDVALAGKVNPQ